MPVTEMLINEDDDDECAYAATRQGIESTTLAMPLSPSPAVEEFTAPVELLTVKLCDLQLPLSWREADPADDDGPRSTATLVAASSKYGLVACARLELALWRVQALEADAHAAHGALERHRKLGGTEDAQSSDPFPTPIPDQTVSLPATATGLQFSRDEVRGGE